MNPHRATQGWDHVGGRPHNSKLAGFERLTLRHGGLCCIIERTLRANGNSEWVGWAQYEGGHLASDLLRGWEAGRIAFRLRGVAEEAARRRHEGLPAVVYRLNKQNAASAKDGGKAKGLGGEDKPRRVCVRNKEGKLTGVVEYKQAEKQNREDR